MLTFADILDALCGIRPEQAQQAITEAVLDSRKVIPGALFIALPGENVASLLLLVREPAKAL